MNSVFLVMGKGWYYDDPTVWVVAAYANRDRAQEHVRFAQEYADSAPDDDCDAGQECPREKHLKASPHDDHFELYELKSIRYQVVEAPAPESVGEYSRK